MCTTPSATPARCTTCAMPAHPAAAGWCIACALRIAGCVACGLVPGQAAACATGCTPAAVCPLCHAAQACTGCGVCYGCGMCPLCTPCATCPQCATGNGAACHACYRAKGTPAYGMPCPRHPAPAYTMPQAYAANLYGRGGLVTYYQPTPCAACGALFTALPTMGTPVCPACTTTTPVSPSMLRTVGRAAYASAKAPAAAVMPSLPGSTSVATRTRWAQQYAGYAAQGYYRATGNAAAALGYASAMLAHYLAH